MSVAQEPATENNALRPTLVRASAGTGKTYQLTARLLRILLQGAAPETILATTFTRKAAAEILERVLKTLAEAADESDEAPLRKLREQVGIPTLPRQACLRLLENLLTNIHRVRICTLDSLFSQLARSFPFELGLPPAWRLTDDIEESWLRERAVEAVIATLDRSEMTTVLSMLGKGETRRSVARELLQVVDTAYTIQRQCSDEAWCQVTAPKLPDSPDITRAAGQLRQAEPPQQRLRAKLDKLAECLELRDFAALAGDMLLARVVAARDTGEPVTYYRSPVPEGLDSAFEIAYAGAKSHVLSLLAAQNEATGTVLAAYDRQISLLKHSTRSLGFEDVSIRLADRFASLGEAALSSRMDGAIDHLLLDEFQDTSPIQWMVLRPLARRAAVDLLGSSTSGPGAAGDEWAVKRSFFCVGDTKQAIYGWRGGVAEIFDAVADQIPGVDEIQQDTSYRSSPVVLRMVNETFRHLGRHPMSEEADSSDSASKRSYEARALRQFAERFPLHTTARHDLAGHVRMEVARCPTTNDPAGRRWECFDRAADIAAELHGRAADKSIGILTRTNRGVAELIYLLEQCKLEVSQEGGNPLTDSAAVEVVLSALMMAEHPGDGRWAFHVRATPLSELPGFGPDWVRATVEDRGLCETIEVLAGVLAPHCSPRETLRLKQLTQMAIDTERHPLPRLRDFVRLVREKRVERPQSAPIRVMTVHQAKGLEFDAVILPELDGPLTRSGGNCVADILAPGDPPRGLTRYLTGEAWHFLSPRWQAAFGRQAAASMTEALCLMYVAMTRARQSLQLVISAATKRDFETRTAASLVFHSLNCDADPTEGSTVLYEDGDPTWWRSDVVEATDPPLLRRQTEIRFRPLPSRPRRNRPSHRPS